MVQIDGSGAILAEVRCYGHEVILNDGSKIKASDKIVELHLNNDWFKEGHKLYTTATRFTWHMITSFTQDLHVMAKEMDNGIFSNCTALHGRTQLGVIAKRLGFQVNKLPDSLWKKGARFYISGLMQVYGSPRDNFELEEVWFSKRELLRRYQ
jgi:hypothetical protein